MYLISKNSVRQDTITILFLSEETEAENSLCQEVQGHTASKRQSQSLYVLKSGSRPGFNNYTTSFLERGIVSALPKVYFGKGSKCLTSSDKVAQIVIKNEHFQTEFWKLPLRAGINFHLLFQKRALLSVHRPSLSLSLLTMTKSIPTWSPRVPCSSIIYFPQNLK